MIIYRKNKKTNQKEETLTVITKNKNKIKLQRQHMQQSIWEHWNCITSLIEDTNKHWTLSWFVYG